MTQEEKKNTEAAAPEAQEPAEQNAGTMAATALPRNQNEAQDKARPEAKAEGTPDEKPEEKAGEKPAEKPRRRRRPLTLVAGGMFVVLARPWGFAGRPTSASSSVPVESATPDTAVRITVETGDSARRVMERLREAGLQVKDFDMRLAARLVKDHKLSSIHTGTYEFKPDLTPAAFSKRSPGDRSSTSRSGFPTARPVWEVLAIFRNATALKQTAVSMPEAELLPCARHRRGLARGMVCAPTPTTTRRGAPTLPS